MLAFSVPAAIPGREAALTYHEATLRGFFQSQGYKPVAINEGLAVIFSELEDNNFTGIGISCGGGMCNVTLAFLSIPSIMFSIGKGGDYIDSSVGAVVNEHATRVKAMKEEGVDLSRQPKDKFEQALHIYYEDLIETLVEALRQGALDGREAAAHRAPDPDRAVGRHLEAEGLQGHVREGAAHAHAADRDLRGAHGQGPAHGHGPRRADRRDVREVASKRLVIDLPSLHVAREGPGSETTRGRPCSVALRP